MNCEIRIIHVQGYTGAGPEHWQTLWGREAPGMARISGVDWNDPWKDSFVASIEREVGSGMDPCCLVAHSLGCAAVVHWARTESIRSVAAALLVAPADVDSPLLRDVAESFRPMPLDPLPFPSTVVFSNTDPYLDVHQARKFANAWGSRLTSAGDAGHLNTASGHGRWPQGKQILAELLERSSG